MTNGIAIILTAALLIDTIANIARLISIEIAYKRQSAMILSETHNRVEQIKVSEKVLSNLLRASIDEIRQEPKTNISECVGCHGNGIDCADGCIKPKKPA